MELRGRFVLTGMEVKHGVKDPNKIYPTVLLSENTQSFDCVCEAGTYDDIEKQKLMFKPVDCLFSYNPKYGSLKLSAVVPV